MQVTITLESMTCGECGVVFGMEQNHKRRLVENDGEFWCPNGHKRVFCSETGYGKLQKKLRAEQDLREQQEKQTRIEREKRQRLERRLVAQRAATTRAKRKARRS